MNKYTMRVFGVSQWNQWYTNIVQVFINGTNGNTICTNGNANGTMGSPNGTIGANGKPMVPLATNGTIGNLKLPMVPLGEPRMEPVSQYIENYIFQNIEIWHVGFDSKTI